MDIVECQGPGNLVVSFTEEEAALSPKEFELEVYYLLDRVLVEKANQFQIKPGTKDLEKRTIICSPID